MREWVKVVLGIAALTIGASAPPLVIDAFRPLDRPSPSSGETKDRHQRNAAEEHQDNQSEQQRFDNAVPTPHTYDNHAVAAKPKDEGDWYTKPDWWVAGFTGALFIATGGLWAFTAMLWYTTRRAVIDGEAALRVAESNAKAARDSADALPALERAYVFLEVDQDTFAHLEAEIAMRERSGASDYLIPSGVRYQFVNHGKTPAIVKVVSAQYVHSTELISEIMYIPDLTAGEVVIRAGEYGRRPKKI